MLTMIIVFIVLAMVFSEPKKQPKRKKTDDGKITKSSNTNGQPNTEPGTQANA